MSSLLPERRRVNAGKLYASVCAEGQAWLLMLMGRRVSLLLAKGVDELLGRERYERRGHVAHDIEGGECCRCHSRQSHQFSRNAGRQRHPLTRLGPLTIRWPRVKCQCGGSVRLNLEGWLVPYQRLDNDVDAYLRRLGAMCLTLRDMQRELAHSCIGPLALRTLNQRVHQLKELTPEPGEVPQGAMILQIDAIWFTQLVPNGEKRADRKGRLRPVKARRKRCLLVALAVWPASARQEILGWQLADSEDAQAWTTFLTSLEEQGVRAEKGLTVIIHDGGEGLAKALQTVHFGAPQQRCLFHKLRNIANALQLPAGLSRPERTRRRKALMNDFCRIWQAQDGSAAVWRYLAIYHKYRDSQPQAVETLRRDFRLTLTYYRILHQHPLWPQRWLRATSRLERFNRSLRRHIQAAGAFHCDDAMLAVIAYEADRFLRSQPVRKARPARP